MFSLLLNSSFRRSNWCQILGIGTSPANIALVKKRRICSLHFKPSDILPTGKLSDSAVPSLNSCSTTRALGNITNSVAQVSPSQHPSVIGMTIACR